MLTNLIVVIHFATYTYISNHYVVHLKQTMLYVNCITVKLGENNEKVAYILARG